MFDCDLPVCDATPELLTSSVTRLDRRIRSLLAPRFFSLEQRSGVPSCSVFHSCGRVHIKLSNLKYLHIRSCNERKSSRYQLNLDMFSSPGSNIITGFFQEVLLSQTFICSWIINKYRRGLFGLLSLTDTHTKTEALTRSRDSHCLRGGGEQEEMAARRRAASLQDILADARMMYVSCERVCVCVCE